MCIKCNSKATVNNRWCDDCFYPGIEDDYAKFREMLKEGYRYIEAAVNSGYRGIEEFGE